MVTPSQTVACPPAMESSARRSVAAGTPPPVPWVVSAADKARYDVMFTNADLDHDQLVSGNEIKDIFLQSGLPQMVLAHIWNICDREADLGAVRAGHVVVQVCVGDHDVAAQQADPFASWDHRSPTRPLPLWPLGTTFATTPVLFFHFHQYYFNRPIKLE